MSIIKKDTRKIIDSLSDKEDWEDLMYKIYIRESIDHGLDDIKNGRILTEEQAKEKLGKWLN